KALTGKRVRQPSEVTKTDANGFFLVQGIDHFLRPGTKRRSGTNRVKTNGLSNLATVGMEHANPHDLAFSIDPEFNGGATVHFLQNGRNRTIQLMPARTNRLVHLLQVFTVFIELRIER